MPDDDWNAGVSAAAEVAEANNHDPVLGEWIGKDILRLLRPATGSAPHLVSIAEEALMAGGLSYEEATAPAPPGMTAPWHTGNAPDAEAWTPTHRHRKGGLYRVIARAKNCSGPELIDVVVYDEEGGKTILVREAAQFDDGRFEPIALPREDGETTGRPRGREWLVIEDSRKNALFADDGTRNRKGYIPRDAAETLFGRSIEQDGRTTWFSREDSEKMRAHPEWRDTEPPESPSTPTSELAKRLHEQLAHYPKDKWHDNSLVGFRLGDVLEAADALDAARAGDSDRSRSITEAVAAERERAAKIVEDYPAIDGAHPGLLDDIASAIRAGTGA